MAIARVAHVETSPYLSSVETRTGEQLAIVEIEVLTPRQKMAGFIEFDGGG
jgi:hypothetical protein